MTDAERERAEIVAWLRDKAASALANLKGIKDHEMRILYYRDASEINLLANAIEALAHKGTDHDD